MRGFLFSDTSKLKLYLWPILFRIILSIEFKTGARMFAIYRVMLPLLLVVFVAMGLWVSFLHFPWEWVMYAVMGLEVCVATVVMAMEYQAQNVGGASGWGSFGFLGLSAYLAFFLGLLRVLIWSYQKFWV
ncbi:MAG: hypothetical protein I4N50_23685, partial [Rhizobium sp.]|nr:hypothetical protein [Rhizobium sp.]